jgi:hypothetical protein
MANTNDTRILELRKQIADNKAKLGKATRFNPTTNCIIELDGIRFNIKAMPSDTLMFLLIKLNAYLMSADALGVADKCVVSGYSLRSWVEDVASQLDVLSRREEEKALTQMEEKLEKLLSEDKQVELQIDNIANMLKG